MSGKKATSKKEKTVDSSANIHETVELPAQEVKKALAQLQAAAAAEKDKSEDKSGESFESKIERAMQKIVSDTLGDEPIDHISLAEKMPRAKTAGTVKVARAKGIRLDETYVNHEQQEETSGKSEKTAQEQEPEKAPESSRQEPEQPVKEEAQKRQEKEKAPEEPRRRTADDNGRGQNGKKPKQRKRRSEYLNIEVPPERKSRKGLAAAAIVIGVLLAGTVGVYAGVGNYYQDKFLPGTNINHIDCSGMTAEEAEEKIRRRVEDYSLTVYAREAEPQVITAESIEYKYQPYDGVEKVMAQQKPMSWVNSFFSERSYTVGESISYNREKVREQMNQLDFMQPDRQTAPVDAHLEYQENQFVIVPETVGTAVDAEKTLEILCKCVEESLSSVDLEKEDVYQKAAVLKDNEQLVQELEHLNSYAKASITYTFGDQTEVLNGDVIRNWITAGEGAGTEIDESVLEGNVYAYVADLAARHDTLGASRPFTTTSGRTINVAGGNYGWQIDQYAEAVQLLEEIRSGQVVSREPNYVSTALQAGPDDIGKTYIEVDLTSQHMYYYREGMLIFESEIVSGKPTPDKATPTGVCHLYYKKLDEVLRGEKQENGEYEYETPVQYWMPFNGGVGFHDANWQASFGGDVYTYNGSHGCINLPVSKAAELYEIIDTETPIVVFN